MRPTHRRPHGQVTHNREETANRAVYGTSQAAKVAPGAAPAVAVVRRAKLGAATSQVHGRALAEIGHARQSHPCEPLPRDRRDHHLKRPCPSSLLRELEGGDLRFSEPLATVAALLDRCGTDPARTEP
jgi:hypothetical protein